LVFARQRKNKEDEVKRASSHLVFLAAVAAAVALIAAGWGQGNAAPAPWPDKSRILTIINPNAAGGDVDTATRILQPFLEKELGIKTVLVNKPGAGNQIGITEIVRAKPDGYTIGYTLLPTAITIYLDPQRKALFSRNDIQPVALHTSEPGVVAVRADSPYKSLKDLLDAAKASPEKIKAGDAGILNAGNLAILQLQEAVGAKFANVHFDGGAPLVTAVMGGHIDAAFTFAPMALSSVKTGQVRLLAVNDTQRSKYYPDVPTFGELGYKVSFVGSSVRPLSAPAATPKEIVDIIGSAIKRAMDSNDYKKRMEDAAMSARYMDSAQVASMWTDIEAEVKPLMLLAK
jgi:tripartite-type tricarboxylate transporter receptor subunit TctC